MEFVKRPRKESAPVDYVELQTTTNFSFLRGASHPEEFVEEAARLGYRALAITDLHSLSGVVRAHVAAKEHKLPLIIGTQVLCYTTLPEFSPEGREIAPEALAQTPSALDSSSEPSLGACAMKHRRRRPDEAISNIRALTTVNGEVGPESPLLFDPCHTLLEHSVQYSLPHPLQYTPPFLSVSLYPTNRQGYGELCELLTRGKRRAPKGECFLLLEEVCNLSPNFFATAQIRVFDGSSSLTSSPTSSLAHSLFDSLSRLKESFGSRLSLALTNSYGPDNHRRRESILRAAKKFEIPLLATNDCLYHVPERKPLQDVLSCIRLGVSLNEAGFELFSNGERYLKPPAEMHRLFSAFPHAIRRGHEIAEALSFSLDELRYQYPHEVCPEDRSPENYLRLLTEEGLKDRYRHHPEGVPANVQQQVEHELRLIRELQYERYFLTVYDIVKFARNRAILCQGRGAAANSAVCYALGITSVDPDRINLLFERFISKERNEPPDIDIDFEHERREEVLQYVYKKYGRHRAALVCEVITYRTRSAVRDVGKVFGLSVDTVETVLKLLRRAEKREILAEEFLAAGILPTDTAVRQTILLASTLVGFPRHLSQHVGGMIISEEPLSRFVPIENAAMENRTVIEWDKDDIEQMGMLKIDLLSLGMLTCIRKAFAIVNALPGRAPRIAHHAVQTTKSLPDHPEHTSLSEHTAVGSYPISKAWSNPPAPERPSTDPALSSPPAHIPEAFLMLHTIPPEDPKVYEMISRADTIGVFQIESRAQMSMLPRMKPRCFYDLVIEVAIVRPGPIQGGMVHPYLRRRMGKERVTYPDERIKKILEPTLGVPLFQEQAMELAIVGAGFSPGEADALRRALASWRRSKSIDFFYQKIVSGMIQNGYQMAFAERCFEQIRGFGEYGFPQSHAASFALLVYVSAWLKYHFPAAFAAALLNSQPMGFYAPSQIIQDAERHGVKILPVDLLRSEWECTVECIGDERISESAKESADSNERGAQERRFASSTPQKKPQYALRLGLRMIHGLSAREVERLKSTLARMSSPASSSHDPRANSESELEKRGSSENPIVGSRDHLCHEAEVITSETTTSARLYPTDFTGIQRDSLATGDASLEFKRTSEHLTTPSSPEPHQATQSLHRQRRRRRTERASSSISNTPNGLPPLSSHGSALGKVSPPLSLRAVWRESGVRVATLRALARGDALSSFGFTRQEALWELRRFRDDPLPLFDRLPERAGGSDPLPLPPPSLCSQVLRDYETVGHSLRAHPLSFLRGLLQDRGAIPNGSLRFTRHGVKASVAGIVLIRQRPSTASGVVFVTLEDETGIANLIIKPNVYRTFRDPICDSSLLFATGTVQRAGEVIHLLVDSAASLDSALHTAHEQSTVALKSRDFQ